VSGFGRVVVGMASAEGIPYGVRALELLRDASAEIHLVMTQASEEALGIDLERVRALADSVYAHENQAAPISSGSFLTRGMVVAPCDGAGLAAITLGLATNLVFRAADVTLKERRPLVLGLAPSRPTAIEEEHLGRAAEVPGLCVVRLEGPEDAAAATLLEQL
jgi:polyprenyl P-hydroxybenzoate/phenylacrylic acid decarboxylase-like protein